MAQHRSLLAVEPRRLTDGDLFTHLEACHAHLGEMSHLHSLAKLELPAQAMIARVRSIIATLLDTGEPSMAALAARHGLSARTLRRRLDEEGTSFRALVDDVRKARARELLAQGVSVSEVSEQLGFAEASAFARAFKRWFGIPPCAYRHCTGAASFEGPKRSSVDAVAELALCSGDGVRRRALLGEHSS